MQYLKNFWNKFPVWLQKTFFVIFITFFASLLASFHPNANWGQGIFFTGLVGSILYVFELWPTKTDA